MKFKYIYLLLIIFGFTACNDDDDSIVIIPPVELVPGSADFSNYVALGNSLTAGYTDGALFIASQENSMPNILAKQFALVGGGSFSQPITNDNVGGLLLGGNVIASPRLYFDGSGPVVHPGTPTTEVTQVLSGSFNNMGVPGAKVGHLLYDGYGNSANLLSDPPTANPYFVRMASAPNTTILTDAMAQSPSFFSLWIGNNDVLGYALSGGDDSNPITDQSIFDFAYSAIVGGLTSNGAQGVVANIPYVSSVPHFTTVPYNPLEPSNPAFGPLIPTLNATFAPLNQAFEFLGMPERSIVFSETEASPMVIHDESIPNISAQLFQVLVGGGLDQLTAGLLANQYGQSRQATPDDLFVLTSSSVIATVNVEYYTQLVTAGVPADTAGQLSVNGITYPMQDKWVLVPSEQEEIKTAIDAFNATIKSVADQAGLAFVDANSLMQQLASTGVSSGDFILNANLVTGGAFSLDGVHPTARGYALLANGFLIAIDEKYGSNFEEAGALNNIGDYPTNYHPALQ